MTENIHDGVGAYALSALSDNESREFEAHLAICELCQEELSSFEVVIEALAEDSTDDPAQAADAPLGLQGKLHDAIFAEIKATDQIQPVAQPASAAHTADATVRADAGDATVIGINRPRKSPVRWFAAAAAAVAVAAVGVGILNLNGDTATDDIVAQYDAVVSAPDAFTLPLGVGDADLTLSEDQSGMAVSGTAPELTEGEQYQLWLINADGTIDPGPTFDAGEFQTAMVGDFGDVSAVAVSVEPAGGSEQPTTDPITVVDV